jgi:DNA-binding NarL/FixJ family response regulator
MRVIVYDDNKHIRDSIEMLLSDAVDIDLVNIYSNTENIIEDIDITNPDVILMDIDMPVMNGIEATAIVKKHYPTIQILMQTVFDDDNKIFNAIKAGASGYLLKEAIGKNLVDAIQEVYLGGSPMSPGVARKVLSQFQSNVSQPKEDYNLSKREKEVLEYLVLGLSYKMIASKMNITYDTVRAHIKKIYEKLHVSSMTEAVAKAISSKMF